LTALMWRKQTGKILMRKPCVQGGILHTGLVNSEILFPIQNDATMRGLNKVTLIGNVGKEPDVKTLEHNVKLAECSIATTETYEDKQQFDAPLKSLVGKRVLLQIHPVNQPALHRYIETLQLKAYSPKTITTYRNEFAQLLYVLKSTNVDDIDAERLRGYFLYCTNTLKLSENTLHSRINAVKFYFEQVLGREKFFFEIPRPKR